MHCSYVLLLCTVFKNQACKIYKYRTYKMLKIRFSNLNVLQKCPLMQDTDKRTDVWSRDFIKWKIYSGLWAVVWAGQWEKRVWAEQLLRPAFSLFRGPHWKVAFKKGKKKYFLGGRNFLFQKNHFLGLKCQCKYIEVGNRLLWAILWCRTGYLVWACEAGRERRGARHPQRRLLSSVKRGS